MLINGISIVLVGSYDAYNVIKAGFGRFWSLHKRYSVLVVLTETVFKCSSNDSDSSRMIPKCFWEEVLLTWLLLNIKGG